MSLTRIGTSGYSYSWNEGSPSPFKWYLSQGFNSVEVNASFYRFPSEGWIRTWLSSPEDFTFSIKVHRSITHFTRLRERSLELWKKFRKSLKELEGEGKIDFWLFQMPSNYKNTEENLKSVNRFFESVNLGDKAVIEFRDPLWWNEVDKIVSLGAVYCSVSAPSLPDVLVPANNVIYLRLHGSRDWYKTVYSEKELDEVILRLKEAKVNKKAIYLNNDHGMLKNGQYILEHF